ncbi:MAG TPA: protein-disulfide reductase DsbD domain-containing protein [bacterium]
MRPWLLLTTVLAFVLFQAAPVLASDSNINHLKVELLSEKTSIQPGESVTVGLHFRIERGWHIYWQNPGDSGQAPSIQWSLPEGFTVGEILWPIPQRITLPSLADYGYTQEVLLMVPLTAPAKLKPGRMIRVSADVRWLVCQDICLPGNTHFSLRLTVRKKKTPGKSRYSYLFDSARKKLPVDLPSDWQASGSLTSDKFNLSFDSPSAVTQASFFPLHPSQVENASPQGFHTSGTSFELKLDRSDQLTGNIKTLEGLLVVGEGKHGDKGYWINVPLTNN